MTIPFTCPHCGASTDVDERYAGSTGPCFQCGQSVTVPMAAHAQTAPAADPYAPGALPAPQKSNTFIWVIVVVACLLGVCCLSSVPLALILPAVQAAREAARRATCSNNLRQIGVALQNYHVDYGTFPPASLSDANGNPAHSWRVLLLPYLDATDVYERYHFDEPWNGPNNSLLADEMPAVYRCPSAVDTGGPFQTSYVGVVGPGLFFDPARAVTMNDIKDGLEYTIAVVESPGASGAGVHWMSPEDLQLDTMNLAINGQPGPSISSYHSGGANVLMADGSDQYFHDLMDERALRSLLTIDSGDAAQLPDEFQNFHTTDPF